jgi:phosphotriesterase-related protein
MTRQELKGRIQTVLGVIDPDDVGPTLMHEHIFCDITPPRLAHEEDGPPITLENVYEVNYGRTKHIGKYRLNMLDVAKSEVEAMLTAGGRTVVELSCGGLKPHPEGLADVARATGANIVMGCGHYVEEYQDPRNFDRSVDDFAAEMVSQVFEGAWGTGVRAGLIGEIGCQAPWTDLEKRVMRAALIAQKETGAALNVHPGRHPDQPQEVVDFIRAHGGDTGRLVISHIDRTIFDEERLFRLADSGCVIEFDLFGIEHTYYPLSDIDMPNDGARLRFIRKLLDRGHGDQVVISHDICYRTRLQKFGGHGYGHIFRNVVPLMKSRGFSDSEIEAILVGTPKRLLTIQ